MAMTKKLYVGNLAFATTSDDLRSAFSAYGTVSSATVITDRDPPVQLQDALRKANADIVVASAPLRAGDAN